MTSKIECTFDLFNADKPYMRFNYNEIIFYIEFDECVYYVPDNSDIIINSRILEDEDEESIRIWKTYNKEALMNTRMFYFYNNDINQIQKLVVAYNCGEYFIEYGLGDHSITRIKVNLNDARKNINIFDNLIYKSNFSETEKSIIKTGISSVLMCNTNTYKISR
jgi:hypothetical protein